MFLTIDALVVIFGIYGVDCEPSDSSLDALGVSVALDPGPVMPRDAFIVGSRVMPRDVACGFVGLLWNARDKTASVNFYIYIVLAIDCERSSFP